MARRCFSAVSTLVCVWAASAPAFADDLPAPVAAAFALAEARSEPFQRWAYTCSWTSFQEMDGVVEHNGETLVARYDPRRPEGEEYELVSPASEDALTEGQQKMWEDFSCRSIDRNPNAEERGSGCRRRAPVAAGPRGTVLFPERDEQTVTEESRTVNGSAVEAMVITASCGGRQEPPTEWDQLAQILGDIELVEETAARKRYAFPLRAPGVVQNVLFRPLVRHFHGEMTITAGDEPRVESFRLLARPFRVPGIARVNVVDVTFHFDEVVPGGPIGPVRLEQQGAFRAMGHRMEAHGTTVFSDFERVTVPLRDPQQAE